MNRIENFDTNRKRNYPQVGEPTTGEDSEDDTARESKGVSVKTVLAGVLSLQRKSSACFCQVLRIHPAEFLTIA